MKTLLSLVIILFLQQPCKSSNNYKDAMLAAMETLKYASTSSQFQVAANTFERISLMEKNEWLPIYYTAHCYIVISYMESDLNKKDPILDKAQQLIDRAFKLAPEESELYALQAFLIPSRIMVDPMGRGMELMTKMNYALDEAIRLNPDNPRSYYLRAITVLNMPENFGGGVEAAKPIFKEAKIKFDSFQPKSDIHPVWGKEQNEEELFKL